MVLDRTLDVYFIINLAISMLHGLVHYEGRLTEGGGQGGIRYPGEDECVMGKVGPVMEGVPLISLAVAVATDRPLTSLTLFFLEGPEPIIYSSPVLSLLNPSNISVKSSILTQLLMLSRDGDRTEVFLCLGTRVMDRFWPRELPCNPCWGNRLRPEVPLRA